MTTDEFMRHLRDAGANEVELALSGSKVMLPITEPHEALEFFNCMLDVLTGVKAAEDDAALDRIRPGFGSTH
ncbi:hypothetical protein HNO88_002742 [Novosphingobium chloroacetimidivorans]|uniref:Uncharacterized protein n=1 Tax=Novosphingobium chloroacetimidivorans TaxID=1428314 RepID=A0A7W7KC92_9SPHN|nr:hypothetical protein [Novosphingobium chloroacetimidivorans]MBB4859413.1 hypothetical protein [Novosphingobium chloroacetimidivorans]